MAKMLIDSKTLEDLANALRSVTGETRSYTPTEMIEAVTNIMETGTYIIVDKNGNEIPAVFVDNEQSFTATANDIRIGTTAVTEAGVTVGEKEIPSYYVSEGYKIVTPGSKFVLPMPDYDYTKLQAIFCPYNTSMENSVSAEKVAIEGHVYLVKSTSPEIAIEKDAENKQVNFGFTNDSGSIYLIRYFSYKEIY